MRGWEGALVALAVTIAIFQVAGWAVAALAVLAQFAVFASTATVALAEKD